MTKQQAIERIALAARVKPNQITLDTSGKDGNYHASAFYLDLCLTTQWAGSRSGATSLVVKSVESNPTYTQYIIACWRRDNFAKLDAIECPPDDTIPGWINGQY